MNFANWGGLGVAAVGAGMVLMSFMPKATRIMDTGDPLLMGAGAAAIGVGGAMAAMNMDKG